MSRLQKTFVLSFTASVVASWSSSYAWAYRTGGSAWPGSPITITYSYVNMFDGGLKMPNGQPVPNMLIRSSIEEAFYVWSRWVPLNFVEVRDGGPVQANLRFRHIFINGPDPAPPADPIPKAQATCIGYGFGCEVQYDDGDRWQEIGTTPQPDLLGASIHEIGHILGLDHSDVVGVNMYWIFHRFQGLGTGQLYPDDIAGIQQIYGAGVGSITTPEPSAFALFFLAMGGWFARRPARRRHCSGRHL